MQAAAMSSWPHHLPSAIRNDSSAIPCKADRAFGPVVSLAELPSGLTFLINLGVKIFV
jgi:hypothetical protein